MVPSGNLCRSEYSEALRLLPFAVVVVIVFETGSHYVVLAVLELVVKTRLTSNSQIYTHLCLLSDEIKGVKHHARLLLGLHSLFMNGSWLTVWKH